MLWIQIAQTGEVIRVIEQRHPGIQLHQIRSGDGPFDNQFAAGIQNGISTSGCLYGHGRTIHVVKTRTGDHSTTGIHSHNLTSR